MPDRRVVNEEYLTIRNEMVELKNRIDVLDTKVDHISNQVTVLDADFRNHEVNEKPMFDEILLAVHQNSKRAEEIRDSVKGYVELQEDLTVLVRFTKKVGSLLTFIGKFTVIFGIIGAASKYIYDWLTKYYSGL